MESAGHGECGGEEDAGEEEACEERFSVAEDGFAGGTEESEECMRCEEKKETDNSAVFVERGSGIRNNRIDCHGSI